jgi:hypothetical protein
VTDLIMRTPDLLLQHVTTAIQATGFDLVIYQGTDATHPKPGDSWCRINVLPSGTMERICYAGGDGSGEYEQRFLVAVEAFFPRTLADGTGGRKAGWNFGYDLASQFRRTRQDGVEYLAPTVNHVGATDGGWEQTNISIEARSTEVAGVA